MRRRRSCRRLLVHAVCRGGMQCVVSTIASWRSYSSSGFLSRRRDSSPCWGVRGRARRLHDRLLRRYGRCHRRARGERRSANGPTARAISDQRLLYSTEAKKVFIKDPSDKLTDAATGEPVASPPSDIDTVRLNNRVRGMLDAALGSLTLMAKEPSRRFDAAQAVFSRATPPRWRTSTRHWKRKPTHA